MDQQSVISTLRNAAAQIRSLRRVNELMGAELQAFHMAHQIATGRPGPHSVVMGAEECYAQQAEIVASELEAEMKPREKPDTSEPTRPAKQEPPPYTLEGGDR
jgi:hypothetical protein